MLNDMNRTELFCEYYAQWIEVYKKGAIREATLAKYLMTQKWVEKLIPEVKVSELTRTAYQQLLNEYAKEHERQTTLDFHHQLKGAILDAVDEGLLPRDPTRKAIIKGKTPKTKKIKYLNQFELHRLIADLPGFSFIIANKEKLIQSKGKARSLSLDLYSQWETMNKDGKWRFTSPTHVVLAFAQALKELEEEGGIPARSRRYADNNRLLISKLGELGIRPYIGGRHQGPIITTFFYPENHRFSFQEMYDYMKERGYAIYPGKVTEADTFRIGNIGEIYKEDIQKVAELIKEFLEQKDMGGN